MSKTQENVKQRLWTELIAASARNVILWEATPSNSFVTHHEGIWYELYEQSESAGGIMAGRICLRINDAGGETTLEAPASQEANELMEYLQQKFGPYHVPTQTNSGIHPTLSRALHSLSRKQITGSDDSSSEEDYWKILSGIPFN